MKTIITAILLIMISDNATAGGFSVFDTSGKPGLTVTGDYLQLAIPVSAAIYSAIIGDGQGNRQLAKAYAATMATAYTLKYTVREERPDQPEGAKGNTFPSGHTSAAFAGAGYWQMRYGWTVGAPMYIAASLVAYSRVEARAHNWLDVITASGIGIGFNLLFTERYNSDTVKVSLSPIPNGLYLSGNLKF